MQNILFSTLIITVWLYSCTPGEPENELSLFFDFEENAQGWTGDFADYPVGDSIFYEMEFGHSDLPHEIEGNKKGLKISGNNHSDDVFMFLKKKVEGLRPNTTYQVVYYLILASNAPSGAVGIGGSPAEGVYLKVGASAREPRKINNGDGFYEMNIDKGNQAEGGSDMVVIGNIAISEGASGYELITRDNEPHPWDCHLPFSITTAADGTLWLMAGTDSGFEGTTTLYYDQIRVLITRQE